MQNPFNPLEAEAIHTFREVAAEAENPVFLYSVGKDSAGIQLFLKISDSEQFFFLIFDIYRAVS